MQSPWNYWLSTLNESPYISRTWFNVAQTASAGKFHSFLSYLFYLLLIAYSWCSTSSATDSLWCQTLYQTTDSRRLFCSCAISFSRLSLNLSFSGYFVKTQQIFPLVWRPDTGKYHLRYSNKDAWLFGMFIQFCYWPSTIWRQNTLLTNDRDITDRIKEIRWGTQINGPPPPLQAQTACPI